MKSYETELLNYRNNLQSEILKKFNTSFSFNKKHEMLLFD